MALRHDVVPLSAREPIGLHLHDLRWSDATSPLSRSAAGRALKRALDVVLAFVALCFALPLMLVIALAVVIDAPGAPMFVQRRVGRSGKPFRLMKFRTMSPWSAEEWDRFLSRDPRRRAEWEACRKVRDDPRVSRVGRFLRRTSLDELPQLLNVVAGHMSIVGPRPVMADELDHFGPQAPLVLSVRPGLTGLWTVSGRSDVAYPERMALEVRYVREWRLGLDLSIIARTIPVVLSGRGAC